MRVFKTLFAPLLVFAAATVVEAGPVAYATCQTGEDNHDPRDVSHRILGCNTVAVACYSAAGLVFGAVAAPVAPPAILACNAALGTCSTACATVALLAPTP
ncbi:hypothetical protein R3P38DRAFT_3187475 [Favolaschia claudopus]|uniref:Uncharacterized protein n=1 Tax=Favolaschia claudopus TaxID=2862362 RepID=A0AAW0BXP3_9AGAR